MSLSWQHCFSYWKAFHIIDNTFDIHCFIWSFQQSCERSIIIFILWICKSEAQGQILLVGDTLHRWMRTPSPILLPAPCCIWDIYYPNTPAVSCSIAFTSSYSSISLVANQIKLSFDIKWQQAVSIYSQISFRSIWLTLYCYPPSSFNSRELKIS